MMRQKKSPEETLSAYQLGILNSMKLMEWYFPEDLPRTSRKGSPATVSSQTIDSLKKLGFLELSYIRTGELNYTQTEYLEVPVVRKAKDVPNVQLDADDSAFLKKLLAKYGSEAIIREIQFASQHVVESTVPKNAVFVK